ncbi:NAD(P)-dependent alcohol dehydrogenase [Loktanella sp. D2R18]|uniref:NAD(P)-dependent alcohol dehydrogenase n=1 Tax=Rhodobacterales TaxID=204455 RepID=UPI000DE9DC13|nr:MULTISPECIES: NAD(P)-dependent alcohol dehydrogenase [Rhodobacterales]MDO6589997.1 NAD(P)-dependent alcohol dehydrogenase [Yoonia sp. 1_MG-2023]RBW45864.1 NAD(P)-dependent alcohol dehydrogenase [Loktanella sp. D2R18]
MLAYSYSRYGSPDVLEQVTLPTPTPQPNEVLVKIHATTVSAGDWRARSLTMPKGLGFMGRLVFGITGPRKPILGTEFSGEVAAVGPKVTNFLPGDKVIGFPGASFGAHAEFITMPSDGKLVRKPDNISFEQAAAIPFGGTTAYDFLVNKAKLQPGAKVLINGASGSVGSACIQIAKHLGAHVTAVCSAKNAQMVTGLGADQVIDYQTQDVITDGVLYDAVVDAVGTLPWAQARHALRPGGQMVLIAGKTSDMLLGSLKARLAGKRLIGGVASERREIIEAVTQLAARGIFQPVIDRNYPFDEMKAAHAHVDTGRKCGNVVVSVT